jgi:hypothetical protein
MVVDKEHLCIAVIDNNQVPIGLIDMLDFCALFNAEKVYHLDELSKKKAAELMSMLSFIISLYNAAHL